MSAPTDLSAAIVWLDGKRLPSLDEVKAEIMMKQKLVDAELFTGNRAARRAQMAQRRKNR